MVNRELIRSKVVQVCYAAEQHGRKDAKVAEKELALSLAKAHDMYMILLLILVNIRREAERLYEASQTRAERLGERCLFNPRMVENRMLRQLDENLQLRVWREKAGDEVLEMASDVARRMWRNIEKADYYNRYITSETSTYAEDRSVVRSIYYNEFFNNDDLDSAFEDLGLYWNADREMEDSFVLRTIKLFREHTTEEQKLLPEFQADDDPQFAQMLLRRAIENALYYDQLIADHARNWVLNRMALMDRIILRVAIAEIMEFQDVPLNVSVFEYVELARFFSTPESCNFVNGILDSILRGLAKRRKLSKAGELSAEYIPSSAPKEEQKSEESTPVANTPDK